MSRLRAVQERHESALLIVRNAFDHDSRVLRAAHTLQSLGFETTVLAVFSWTERRQLTDHDGIQVRRIGPTSRLAWFVYSHVSTLAPISAKAARSAPHKLSLEPVKRLVRPFMRWVSTLVYYGQGVREVRRLAPELVHCNDYNTVWIGLAAKWLCGSRVLYDSHELWPDRNGRPEPRWWLLLCERFFVRHVDAVITASPGYSAEMERRYGIPLPPAVCNVPDLTTAERASLPPERADGTSGRVAVYVGGLLTNRGLEQSIRAIAKVPGATVRIVGPSAPAYRARLDALIEAEGVGDQVEIVPPVPPSDVVRTLADSDVGLCLIQPACLSYVLTMPNKLYEYTLAGLPVLGSDFPVIGQFVRERGIGLTVDPEDIDAIAAALRELLDPVRNAEFRAATASAAAEIDWNQEESKLIEVYRELLPAGRAA